MTFEHNNFSEFYALYLSLHAKKGNRILHFVGATLIFIVIVNSILSRQFGGVLYGLTLYFVYSFIGNYHFEKKPYIYIKHPIKSLMAEGLMWWQLLRRKIFF